MKRYYVRADPAIIREFTTTFPWGFHSHVMEALMKLALLTANREGASITTVKLMEGLLMLEDKEDKTDAAS